MLLKLAGLTVRIDARYPYLPLLCRDYTVPEGEPELTICATEEDLLREGAALPQASPGYLESVAVYRKLCDALALRGVVLLHAAVLVTDGRAYAFTAKSGTGKSTHLKLWMDMLGDRAFVLNGDKPLMRLGEDGQVWIYGSPWCGKEGWNRNTSAPLGALCFLERDMVNRIAPLPPEEGVERILPQLLRPSTPEGVLRTLSLADECLRRVPLFLLGCNISPEAAALSYAAMHG